MKNSKENRICAKIFVFFLYRNNLDTDDRSTITTTISSSVPMSPSHYKQPPTPEHPPPNALQAENFIHDRIRPLSQVGEVDL